MLIIDCPSCAVQFRVPPAAIPPEGRVLRCSTCGHTWHYVDPLRESLDQVPAPAFLQSAAPPPVDNFSAVLEKALAAAAPKPTPPRNRVAMVAGYGAAFLVMVATGWLMGTGQGPVTALLPKTQAVYTLFGMPPIPPKPAMNFEAVQVDIKDAKVTVQGMIKNNTGSQKWVPTVRVVLHGMQAADGKPVAWVFRPENVSYIDPGKTAPFTVSRAITDKDHVTAVDLSFIENAAE